MANASVLAAKRSSQVGHGRGRRSAFSIGVR